MPARLRSRSRLLVAGLLALCLTLSGIAPSVSRVIAARSTADLCGAAASAGSSQGGHRDAVHDAACRWCVTHGSTFAALPPAHAAIRAVSAIGGRARPEPPAGARVGPGWNAADARGPPAAPAG
jgi:hypothetical protein